MHAHRELKDQCMDSELLHGAFAIAKVAYSREGREKLDCLLFPPAPLGSSRTQQMTLNRHTRTLIHLRSVHSVDTRTPLLIATLNLTWTSIVAVEATLAQETSGNS